MVLISKIDCRIANVTRANAPIASPTLKLGGKPVFISRLEHPICKHCGQPMDFIGQIPLDAPLKFSSRFRMAYVFMCPGKYDDRGWLECENWRAFSGANAVLLQEDNGQVLIPSISPRYADYVLSLTPIQEPNIDRSDSTNSEGLAEQVSILTKIGGVPGWVQNNETPTCPTCQEPMQFVAQIDAELDGPLPADATQWSHYSLFGFGDAGLGYVFVCRNDCSENGAFLWQSG